MAGIFISYRRSDAGGWAGRLSDSLRGYLGRLGIFRDIDDIPPGVEFDAYINDAVGSCDVLLALIGPQWLTTTNQTGQRRLDEPADFTRLEIATALSRKVRVIPVLVGGARMPNAEELPEDLKPLSRRQAYELTDARWAEDCRKLAQAVRPELKGRGWRGALLAVAAVVVILFVGLGLVFLNPWSQRPVTGSTGPLLGPSKPTGEVVSIRTDGQSRSYDFRTKRLGDGPTGGDFYFSGTYPAFYANNRGQRGVMDLGEVAAPLNQVTPPTSGFRPNVNAVIGRTYAALANEEHSGDVIVFRVLDVGYRAGKTELYQIEVSYRPGAGAGTEKVVVPNVVGQPFAEAGRQLVAAGLSTGPVERHSLRRYPSGTVYNQTPTAGAQVNRGDAVKVYVDVTPPPEYQATGSMALKPLLAIDLDRDPAERGLTSPDFMFSTKRGWQLQPLNSAQIAEVPEPRGALTVRQCADARLSREPVNLTFQSPQMLFCVMTNRGRLAFLRVSKQGDDEIAVVYNTWKSEQVVR